MVAHLKVAHLKFPKGGRSSVYQIYVRVAHQPKKGVAHLARENVYGMVWVLREKKYDFFSKDIRTSPREHVYKRSSPSTLYKNSKNKD